MLQISFQDTLQTSLTKQVELGSKACTPDGNIWIYTYNNSGATITKGFVAVPKAVTSVGTTISSSTNNAGQNVFITKASAGWTVGAFQNGYVLINLGTGTGQVAKIKDNTTDTLELYPAFALATALSTDSTMAIWTQYIVRKALVTTKIQNATGIAQVSIPDVSYAWVLKEGLGTVVAGEALTVGGSFVTGDDTAGEVVKGTTAKGAFDEQTLGVCIVANSAADLGALVQVTL